MPRACGSSAKTRCRSGTRRSPRCRETILHTARFHLIGHLQSNKTARAAAIFAAVDTVDSLKIAERLNAAAIALGRTLPVLIEVKLSSEESKHGIAPGAVSEILHAAASLPALQLRGLMTVPPFFDDPEDARPYFSQLRELRDSLNAVHPHTQLTELSMGMSHDFAVAIEEGSTCVRIGTALFGKRDYSQNRSVCPSPCSRSNSRLNMRSR